MFAWRTIWVCLSFLRVDIDRKKLIVGFQDFFFYREFNLNKVKEAHLANAKNDI